jgi:hypothetical protein
MEPWMIAAIVVFILLIIYVSYCFYVDERKKWKLKIDDLALEITYLKKHNEYVEAEKYKNWGNNLVVTGPFTMRLKEPAKQCVFSQWEISDEGSGRHQAFCLVYGKGNAEKVLKALNS